MSSPGNFSPAESSYDGLPQDDAGALRPRPQPKLKPLAPPKGSPAWAYKEPSHFIGMREREAERLARTNMKLVYRRVLQSMGHVVCLQKPSIPTTIDSDPPPRFQRPPFCITWGHPPYKKDASMKPSSPLSKPLRSSKSFSELGQARGALVIEDDDRAVICGQKARMSKATWRTLQGWSRCASGSPWTLNQVYAEIDADCRHCKAKDTRAKRGFLSPEVLGPGATQNRRPMVPFKRLPGFENGDGNSSMRSCISLPALTDNSAPTGSS